MKSPRFFVIDLLVSILVLMMVGFNPQFTWAQPPVVNPGQIRAAAQASGLEPLGNVPVPVPNLAAAGVLNPNNPEADRDLLRLGKALFWDMQVGSDGQACGSCHFEAGADRRAKNQLNPDTRKAIPVPPRDVGDVVNTPAPDNDFGSGFGPNYTLVETDFPFHKLENPEQKNFPRNVLYDTNDVASSQGAFNADFYRVKPHGTPDDKGVPIPDALFNVNGINTRRVEPRNTPTNINAVFNFSNFWDGRAHNTFNGESVVGPLDQNAKILVNVGGNLQEQKFAVTNSSLASQAVGPPVSRDEMAFNRRFQAAVGKKVMNRKPLAKQLVHPQDSVLGPLTSTKVHNGKVTGPQGLKNTTYADLIKAAFDPKYWDSDTTFTFNSDGTRNIGGTSSDPKEVFAQIEGNFAFFFGLAVQRYEQTLVSDDTPLDRFMAGNDTALTPRQLQGLLVFLNQKLMPGGNNNAMVTAIAEFETANPGIIIGVGNCISCHGGAELTVASVREVSNESIEVENTPRLEGGLLQLDPGKTAMLDKGFANTGVRRTDEDLGRGGEEGQGQIAGNNGPFPLSFTRQAQLGLPFPNAVLPNPLPSPEAGRSQVDGAFKMPGLRNVELTGPYFHNGGQATLAQVIEFYNRQSDFGDVNIANIYINLISVDLKDQDEAPLIDFMIALTDDRVRNKLAPFDHPQLFVPDGHPGDQNVLTCSDRSNGVSQACDDLREIPPLGKGGLPEAGLPPLQPFLNVNHFGN
jgi:cytochrome c peroxidase